MGTDEGMATVIEGMVGMVGCAMDTIVAMADMLLILAGTMAPRPPMGTEAIATDMARELSSLAVFERHQIGL